jgi:hypothetical protein
LVIAKVEKPFEPKQVNNGWEPNIIDLELIVEGWGLPTKTKMTLHMIHA